MRDAVYFIKTNVYILQIFKDRHPYFLYSDQGIKAATVVEYAHYLSNKEITISNRIYGIICPRINIRILARKPTQYKRVIVDLKAS